MNKQRRKEISKITSDLQDLRSRIEDLRDEEQEGLYNMEEKFSETEKFAKAEEARDALDYAIDSFDEITSNLETASE